MKIRLINKDIKDNYAEELLKERGITNINEFINPPAYYLEWPDTLLNIDEGVELIGKLNDKHHVLIIVDSDVDGQTSAAIIYLYLKKLKPNLDIEYTIHQGKQHGLEDKCESIVNSYKHFDLVICPDSSSNDYEYHNHLAEVFTRVLVLDHHLCEGPYSSNAVIINNQISPNYSNKELTGAGVTWQFCRYCDYQFGTTYSNDLIDLAALGIIGDMGSALSLENRWIIYNGLRNIKNFFLDSIITKQSYSMNDTINYITVAFYVVPLINALIRTGEHEEKIRLFEAFINGMEKIPSKKRGATGELEFRAIEALRECTNAKARQKKISDNMTELLSNKIEAEGLNEHKIIFIKLDDKMNFPPELNGYTAMSLASKYKKPVLIGRKNEEGEWKGSFRSPSNSPIPQLKSYLESTNKFEWCQGHEGAAGFCIIDDNVEDFIDFTDEDLTNVDFGEEYFDVNFIREGADEDIRNIVIDCDRISDTYGQNNSEPLIYVNDIDIPVQQFTVMGKQQNTLKICYNGIDYVKFFATDLIEQIKKYNGNVHVEIVGKMQVNTWNNKMNPQIIINNIEIKEI